MECNREIRTRLEPDVSAGNPVFDLIISALSAGEPIAYSKINHGFWERLVALEAEGFDVLETDSAKTHEMDHFVDFRRPTPHMFEGGFARDVLDVLQKYPDADENHIFSAGLLGWPGRLEVAGISHDERDCEEMIQRFVPVRIQSPEADGMAFKWALISGAYEKFADILRQKKSLLVGNQTLSRYYEFMRVESGQFLEIHTSEARAQRDVILGKIESVLKSDPDLKVVLLQAGGSLSAWLIYYLRQIRPDVSFIDIGMGTLICNPSLLFKTAEGRVYQRQFSECMDRIHPGWKERMLSDDLHATVSTGRHDSVMSLLEENGVTRAENFFDPEITINTPLPSSLKPPADVKRVKKIHEAIDNPHDLAGHLLKRTLSLSDNDHVILCQSRKTAIELCSSLIPSAERILFPDHAGLRAWNQARRTSRLKNTELIIENFKGLLDRPKSERPAHEVEILSCDASTPWGVGDCSALILSGDMVRRADENLAQEKRLSPHACCVLIECLERYERWSFFYNRQMRRIRQLIERNFTDLTPWPSETRIASPQSCLSYLSARPTSSGDLDNPFFEISVRGEADLEGRIIDMPCHPYMRHISNRDFIATIRKIMG